jgi:hypothetical protein
MGDFRSARGPSGEIRHLRPPDPHPRGRSPVGGNAESRRTRSCGRWRGR